MKTHLSKSGILLILLLLTAILSSDLFAQQVYGINDKIGGGSGSTDVQSSDDGLIYIVGGVVIAGIIIYALTRDKKEVKSETDSTKADLNLEYENLTANSTFRNKSVLYELPVEFYLGVQRINYFNDNNKYVVGVRFSL